MTRALPLILLLTLAGCQCAPSAFNDPDPTGEPWDTAYLIDADPSEVTDQGLLDTALAYDDHLWKYCQVEGVLWPATRSSKHIEYPNKYYKGADSALFTGYMLAAYAFKAKVTGSPRAFERALASLRGLYWMTHVGGRGVIARFAFPVADGAKWDYPGSRWERHPGFVHEADGFQGPLGPAYPRAVYYTRATRDQFTGITLGLSVAWDVLVDVPQARAVIATIAQDMRDHLEKHNWRIRDVKGENDTNADKVDGFPRLQFEALYRRTVTLSRPEDTEKAAKRYDDWFHTLAIQDVFNVFNSYMQYFAHNLRISRALGIWMLEHDAKRKKELGEYVTKAVWRYTKGHQNAWFAVIASVTTGDDDAPEIAREALASLSLKPLRAWGSPYAGQERKPDMLALIGGCGDNWVVAPHLRKDTAYGTWQKEPWDVGEEQDEEGLHESPGLDFTLAYWAGRYFGVIR